MRVLIDHPFPFFLAHGGLQHQVEQTAAALQRQGLEVENVRWWDDTQRGDLIHFFGRPSASYIDLAHGKGMKVVVAELHTGMGSRPGSVRLAQKILMRVAAAVVPGSFLSKLAWEAYTRADAFVALTPWEKHLMVSMFKADPRRVHVIANGVDEVFFQKSAAADRRKNPLICTATITPRKRVLELARAAAAAHVPVRIVGKPYSEQDPYHRDFLRVRDAHPEFVLYDGPVYDREAMARLYRDASGFVLLSSMESQSLSALEAAAAGCPLLLSDLPWARTTFAENARYAPMSDDTATLAGSLRSFARAIETETAPLPDQPLRWDDVAVELRRVYARLHSGEHEA